MRYSKHLKKLWKRFGKNFRPKPHKKNELIPKFISKHLENEKNIFYIKKCFINKIKKHSFLKFLDGQFINFKILPHKKYLKISLE